MYSLGIDVGYSAVKIILMGDDYKIKYKKYVLHKGSIREVLKNSIKALTAGYKLEEIQFGAVTGNGSKFLTKINEALFVNEVAAIVEGSTHTSNRAKSIIEIGGESAKYITSFSENDKSRIEISMNSDCSAGTGSFLEEQMSRLGLKLEDYSIYASKAKSIPRIAGRCSVFAKTDIIHHQQEGAPIEDILLGLAYAVVKNYRGTIMKKLPMEKPILFSGGVAHNQGIITALKDVLKLDEGELIIPEHFNAIGAFGAAIIAKKNGLNIDLIELLNFIELEEDYEEDCGVKLPPLASFGNDDSLCKHVCKTIDKHAKIVNCYLGIDVGSTSTNLVLMDEDNEILSYKYLKTLGNPIEAVRTGLKELKEEIGQRVNVIGAGTTGSGRYMIGEFIGADAIKDEITAQAKAAVTLDGEVDTIFEIGGQDSKYISLENGIVIDFQMNKICAAGTGSFIEEQAKKFNIPINKFGGTALVGESPINLGERCTVFIETSIAASLSKGAQMENIASGLCYSIAKNYIGRVVGQKKIGRKIFFQGGVAHNQGVINAIRSLTGKAVVVPPFFSVTGAYGVAILTKEEVKNQKIKFKGFDIEADEQYIERRKKNKRKTNEVYLFDENVKELMFEDYSNVLDSTKKTIGIPRALFNYSMFSMFNAIFKALGFNVLLSSSTNEETIRLAQQYALDETCYPVKLIAGHIAELVEKKVDYIFFPNLLSSKHPRSTCRANYGCAYMQPASKLMNQIMGLEKKGIELLTPTIGFHLGEEFIMENFLNIGRQLGKSLEQTQRALKKGIEARQRHHYKVSEYGRKSIEAIQPDEKAFVIISKSYGVVDPVLNMGIPAKLMEMGYKIITFYNPPEGNISKKHHNMFWSFGQHILEMAELVKAHSNLYGVLLTHYGCGPDSIISHYFREEMDGKPYLHIEVDEHSSKVGVITRIEAFINSLNDVKSKKENITEVCLSSSIETDINIKKGLKDLNDKTILYLPNLYPYSEILKEILIHKGINTIVLPKTSLSSLDIGRKFTITEEYLSLTGLLGDVFQKLYRLERDKENIAFFIPQNEGTETDGQYSRLIRTKLDEEGFKNVDIISPFIENTLNKEEDDMQLIFLGLLAGDIVMTAPKKYRDRYLLDILDLIKNNCLKLNSLKEIASEIHARLKSVKFNKRVLVTGEALVLYNDFLNDNVLNNLEKKGHRVVYSPLSEAIWLFWKDYLNESNNKNTSLLQQSLNTFKENINQISKILLDKTPFEEELENLITIANETIGYYCGGNGRYRAAKILGELKNIDGNITVASTYENTGIALGILHKGFDKGNQKPILNLTFDGNKNENIETKIQSFMYYL